MKNNIKKRTTDPHATPPCITTQQKGSAFIDYLSVRFTDEFDDAFIENLSTATGLRMNHEGEVSKKILGQYYATNGLTLTNNASLILFHQNGNSKTLIIPGNDCANIADWQAFHAFLDQLDDVSINRIDIALDTEAITLQEILKAHRSGAFNVRKSKMPIQTIGDIDHDDGSARTIAIGKREAGKYLRCYEKGRTSAALPEKLIRLEVELKKSKDKQVPLKALTDPLPYFCGAFTYLAQFGNGYSSSLETIPKNDKQASYSAQTASLKNSYGQFIQLMLAVEPDAEAVIEQIKRDGYPKGFSHEDIEQLIQNNPHKAPMSINSFEALYQKLTKHMDKQLIAFQNKITPAVIRLKDAPAFLGMDKNKFNKIVRPYVHSFRYGTNSIAFNRIDLEQWAVDYSKRTECSKSSITNNGDLKWDNQKQELKASTQKPMVAKQSAKFGKENESTKDLEMSAKRKPKRGYTTGLKTSNRLSNVQKTLDMCLQSVQRGT